LGGIREEATAWGCTLVLEMTERPEGSLQLFLKLVGTLKPDVSGHTLLKQVACRKTEDFKPIENLQ
jgi:UDP-N-acetylglucosamine 2-epimerase